MKLNYTVQTNNYIWKNSQNSEDLTLTYKIEKSEVEEPTVVGSYAYTGKEITAKLSYESDLFEVTGNVQTNVGEYELVVSLKDKDAVKKTANRIVNNAKANGAEMLITACPACWYNLKKNSDGQMPVKYLTELLAQALGLI